MLGGAIVGGSSGMVGPMLGSGLVVSALAVGRGWLRVGWRRRCERVCGGMSILQIVRSICWSTLH